MSLITLLIIFLTTPAFAYVVQRPPESGVFTTGNELYKRDKCKTCCKMAFVSDYNPNTGKVHEKNSKDMYYALELEMDKEFIRYCESNWEQTILAKPLLIENELQQFELAPYKMFISYPIPQRVHDIRGGIKIGSKLIIWKKKAPLAASTNNQRFVFNHPYSFYGYDKTYAHHITAPFYTQQKVCYELTNTFQFWTGNNELNCGYRCREGYQVKINVCDPDNAKQKFNVIFI